MAEAGHAGRHDARVDRHLLPAVAIGRRGVGHPPGRAAVAQDHVAEVSAADRPGKVGVPAMAERRAAGLDRIAAAGPLEPFGPDAADRHPLERLVAGLLQVQRGRSDRPAHERLGVDVEQAHLLDALELEPGCAAVVAVGFLARPPRPRRRASHPAARHGERTRMVGSRRTMRELHAKPRST